jgi:hypothetical protein
MPEWSQFKTVQEMIDACQIPEKRLKKMSTQAVIQAIWEYPFFINALHRATYQRDFESTFLTNNAYKALTKRADAGKSLLKRLELVKLIPEPEARYMLSALELLMSQTVFLSQLNDKEKKTIIEITLKNDSVRQQVTTVNIFRGVTVLLMGKTMLNAGYLPFIEEMDNNEQLKTFLTESTSLTFFYEQEEFMRRIIFHGENFIK